MTPPKPRPSFGEFVAPETPGEEFLDRADFNGLPPEEAVDRMIAFECQKKDLEDVTVAQKRRVVKMMLTDLQKKGIDLSSATEADVSTYRAFLHQLVKEDVMSRNYAGHLVCQWNALMRAAFGEASRPGEGLIMRGFSQSPKKIHHLNEDDFARMVQAVERKRFESRHYRELFGTYLELAWCCCARVGSLNTAELQVRHIDWDNRVLSMKHMKNMDEHDAVLTDRCVERLRSWVDFLRATPVWQGRQTPLLLGPQGHLVSNQWLNRALKQVAALAGVRKPVTTHVIRKSGGTLMARENPKLAQEQLGVTWKIFNRHYNQPLLEDRIARRDILPGAAAAAATAEERIGQAYLRYQRGLLSEAELEEVVQRARIEPKETKGPDDSVSYA